MCPTCEDTVAWSADPCPDCGARCVSCHYGFYCLLHDEPEYPDEAFSFPRVATAVIALGEA